MPSILGRNISAVFGYLKERLRDVIKGWDKKMLSKGGKEILLKTVAQALPNYAMSIFLLPQQLSLELERLMTRFWWKSYINKDKGITWLSWDRMSSSMTNGGMGFRKLREFNITLVGKQGWRLITNENSLVSRIFKARYYPRDSFLSAKIGHNPSYVWRNILEAHTLLKWGAVRRVGSWRNISITTDPWLPDAADPYIHTNHEAIKDKNVAALMVTGQNQWDVDLVNDIFNTRDADLILSIPLRQEDVDFWC